MCYHTRLDYIIYMDVQMQNKYFVNTSQVIIYNSFYSFAVVQCWIRSA